MISESNQKDESSTDKFVRSAFNRYYYSAYLYLREALVELRGDKQLKHKQVPDIMAGQVRQRLKSKAKKLEKLGNQQAAQRYFGVAKKMQSLSPKMSLAYDVRVAADYYPDEKVVHLVEDFELKGMKLSEMQRFTTQIETLHAAIISLPR